MRPSRPCPRCARPGFTTGSGLTRHLNVCRSQYFPDPNTLNPSRNDNPELDVCPTIRLSLSPSPPFHELSLSQSHNTVEQLTNDTNALGGESSSQDLADAESRQLSRQEDWDSPFGDDGETIEAGLAPAMSEFLRNKPEKAPSSSFVSGRSSGGGNTVVATVKTFEEMTGKAAGSKINPSDVPDEIMKLYSQRDMSRKHCDFFA